MDERKDIQSQEAVLPEGEKKRRRQRRRGGPSISTVIAVIVVIIGAGLIAYPTFSDWWNSYHQSRAIANYVQAVEELDPEVAEAMINRAVEYNEALLSKADRYNMTDADKAEYESILDLTGSGVIGYIQINAIGVNLPVYHGVSESVLQVAIGHIEGTSLPVGGPSTHAAVSGHRGLPSARLFTDLDKLVEGDTFTMTVLDRTITYEIDQIRIVEPSDLSDLNIERDKDYMTLITCTPYGVNTHRMLVRGHRIENITGMAVIPPEAVQIPNYIAVPAVGLPMLFIYLIGALIYYRGKGDAPDMELALEELREQAAAIESATAGGIAIAGADADAASSEIVPGADEPVQADEPEQVDEPEEDAMPEQADEFEETAVPEQSETPEQADAPEQVEAIADPASEQSQQVELVENESELTSADVTEDETAHGSEGARDA